jgi:hypothetical protein
MPTGPIEILDPILLKRILLTMGGLFSCFMGLWIYRSTMNAIGFLVGMGYAAYIIFIFFTKTAAISNLTDIQFLLLLAGGMLLGGFLGLYLAKAFEFLTFFLAGGIIAIVLYRLWFGSVTLEDLRSLDRFRDALTSSFPSIWEFFVFLVGGILYVINVRVILAITTSAVGGLLVRWAWGDVLDSIYPHGHDYLAVSLMVIGTIVQMKSFKGKREIILPRYRRIKFEKM